jgi:alkyl hydroperoxide reductase subunit AhpC
MGLLLNLGDIVPEFNANSTLGNISWHSWIEGSWAMLISHPANFGGVCTSELAHLAKLSPDYSKR